MNASPSSLIKTCIVIFLFAACTSARELRPLSVQSGVLCPDISPGETFTAIHQIVLSHAAIGKSVSIGAVKADPRTGELHAVLMTLEGLVVCEAKTGGGRVEVLRALPPLNAPGFAEGLMADVAFLFHTPSGKPVEIGLDEEGNPACRWRTEEGGILETARMPKAGVRTRLYDREGAILKEALASPPFNHGLSAQTRLKVFAPVNYTLDLTLIDVEGVD